VNEENKDSLNVGEEEPQVKTFFARFIQPVGALIFTVIAMWYLLGIPASILWEPFYQRLTDGIEKGRESLIDNQ